MYWLISDDREHIRWRGLWFIHQRTKYVQEVHCDVCCQRLLRWRMKTNVPWEEAGHNRVTVPYANDAVTRRCPSTKSEDPAKFDGRFQFWPSSWVEFLACEDCAMLGCARLGVSCREPKTNRVIRRYDLRKMRRYSDEPTTLCDDCYEKRLPLWRKIIMNETIDSAVFDLKKVMALERRSGRR